MIEVIIGLILVMMLSDNAVVLADGRGRGLYLMQSATCLLTPPRTQPPPIDWELAERATSSTTASSSMTGRAYRVSGVLPSKTPGVAAYLRERSRIRKLIAAAPRAGRQPSQPPSARPVTLAPPFIPLPLPTSGPEPEKSSSSRALLRAGSQRPRRSVTPRRSRP